MSQLASPEQRKRPGIWLVIMPCLLLGLSYVGLALPWWWHQADLNPAPIGMMKMCGIFFAIGCWFALPIWFFGFTWVSRKIKAVVLLLALIVAGGLYANLDEVVLDAELRPHFYFSWDRRSDTAVADNSAVGESADLPAIDTRPDPLNDFPRYRGRQGDGIVRSTELLDREWSQGPPRERWRRSCGGGFSGFAVAGNVAVTMEQRGEEEAVVCYDRDTGSQRWVHAYPALFKDSTGNGPRSTPTLDKGDVFTLGATGELFCLDATTGKPKWGVNVLRDNAAKNIIWGLTGSPLIEEDLVIVNAGIDPDNNAGRSLVAYNRRDGKRIWGGGKNKAGYSSPIIATLAGRRQILLFDAGGLAGFDPKSGEELWRYPWVTWQDMNIIQPLQVPEDRLLISSELSNGCALIRIVRNGEKLSPEVVWESKALAVRQVNPVIMGRSIFGLHNGTFVCVDLETGQRRYRGKFYGQGQMLAVGNSILVLSEQGDLALVAADPKRFNEIRRIAVFPDRRTWNTPAMAGRQIFLRNDSEMACYEWPLKE